MRDTLHWLLIRQRVLYRVSTFVCVIGAASVYLSEFFVQTSSCLGRQSLCTASRPSRWLVPLSGMVSLLNCALSHVICLAPLSSSKVLSLPSPRLGAPLSSSLEGVLYKSFR